VKHKPFHLAAQKRLIFAAAALAGGWLASADAAPFTPDPTSDPTKPSNRFLEPPPFESDEEAKAKAKSLKLPNKPGERPAKASGPTVTLQRVLFDGNTAVSTAELEAVAAPYLNRPLSGDELEDLRYKATLLYVNRGYISSGALIEGQTLKNGELHIKIVEGRLSDVKVTDNTAEAHKDEMLGRLRPLRDSYIKGRLAGDTDEPLNTHDLQERYVLLLNDPLVERLNGTLMPGLHPGEAVLDVKVVRARPYGVYLGADNYSPPYVGSYAGRMGTWVSNLSGFGERIDFNFSATGGSNTYNTGIDIPLNPQGTRFAFRYTNSNNTLVEPPFNSQNVNSNIISYDGQLSHPVYRDLTQKATLGLNFNVRQDYATIDGTVPALLAGNSQGKTQETVVRAWQDYIRQAPSYDLAFRSTFSVGVNALGATVSNQNIGDGRFFDWLGQGVGRYRLPESEYIPAGTFISLSGAVQVSDDKLLPLEKMAIGGVYTVRGYRQNYLVRDQGFYTALELSYPLYPLWGGVLDPRHGLYLVPFVNYGGAWDYNQSATYVSSAGLGLDLQYETFNASLYWAERLDSYHLPRGTPYDLQDNGVTFQVKWQSN
jgi:hemolysin activation/secretion protein